MPGLSIYLISSKAMPSAEQVERLTISKGANERSGAAERAEFIGC